MKRTRSAGGLARWVGGIVLMLLLSGCASPESAPRPAETEAREAPVQGEPDVPYVPTPGPVMDRMLELAEITADDVVYDLGSGDGRIVIAAARRYGARGVGIEIDSALVRRSRANAKKAGVDHRVTFRHQNLFNADLSPATVVMVYLLPGVNMRLRPKLFRELAAGTRVVSHDFRMGEWTPDTVVQVDSSYVYRWTIPAAIPRAFGR